MKRWLFEEYKVDSKGVYHLISNFRTDGNEKRKKVDWIKSKGYSYDRIQKEYIRIPDPTETTCVTKYVWVVSSFNI